MNKFFTWLLGSVHADKKRSPQASEGGSFEEAKSVKKNEIPQKGQFNIMVGYNQQNVLAKERSRFNVIGNYIDRSVAREIAGIEPKHTGPLNPFRYRQPS